ncbi:Radical SAM superfamily enzyme YgiQ, UPF0313 family [Clostridium collagenovorans DSM 3089]|uniref:Radical SAM superfamily enzyme YgiQ, UPF0313 family n=1 Tax=Clostridium collagenovorans DSM 3089 TaxID=1121306 RepID=A0A1M5TZM0_9CLOT|nr:B12-binding domain-containing radical SAM protein [Clostridium collagenovorans]SHH56050.1 Radical SAM superfamily enzyme YgiQ, UPF0313 family [Clostridium collagenovorans DSM 3089]
MKVLLTAINSQYVHSNLAIKYLRAYTKDIDYDLELVEYTINDRKERVLEDILFRNPDVITFSCYIWNIEYINELVKLIRLLNKNIKIVIGGPEVSYNNENLLRNNTADYIIVGEGEASYRELILYLKGEIKDIREVKGIYFKENENIIFNGYREILDFNSVKFPYEEEDDLDNKIVYYEASRGCPFRCKYCLSSVDRKVRFLNLDRVKSELQYFIDKKVKLVKFVDRTFNCKHDFSMGIWEFLINAHTDTKFHFEISADLLNEEEITLLKKAPKGRFQFEVGVQTTNDEVLKNINRQVKFNKIKENVKAISQGKNIMQHLDLIAGLPDEDFESFKKSFNDVYEIKPDEIQLGFLKIIKGSPMADEVEMWGMIYSPFTPYEILKTNSISYYELILLKRVEEMVDKYYNTGKFENIINYFVRKFESPFDFYYELGNFFYDKGYFNRSISSSQYYKVFLEFNNEVLKEEQCILKEIIKFDYMKYNKKKWIPEFLNPHMDKKEERELKEKLSSIELGIEKNNIHIEKYNIKISEFIKNFTLNNIPEYVAYDVKDEEKIVFIC